MKEKNHKWVFVIIVVLVAIVVVEGYYLINNNKQEVNLSQEPVNWATYSVTDLGLSMMYPSSWKAPQKTLLGSGEKISFNNGFSLETSSLYDNSTGKMRTFNEFVAGYQSPNYKNYQENSEIIGGVSGAKISYIVPQGANGSWNGGTPVPSTDTEVLQALLPMNNSVLIISYEFDKSQATEQKALFQKIISSIVFNK